MSAEERLRRINKVIDQLESKRESMAMAITDHESKIIDDDELLKAAGAWTVALAKAYIAVVKIARAE